MDGWKSGCGSGGGSATGLVLQGPAAVVALYAPLAWVALRRLVAR